MAESPSASVRIERSFAVSPEKVWQGWTDPALVRQWFGSDPAGQVSSARLDVRPGGSFEVSFTDGNGTAHTCSGAYVDVQPAQKLSFSWRWANEPGIETLVRVTLEAQGAGTLMRFEHSRLGHATLHDYEAGWRRTFVKLARALAAQS